VVSATRRGLLLGGASVVLAGCGATADPEDSAPGESETGRRADAEVLNAALEVKHRAARRYASFPVLAGAGAAEQEHLERLADEITRLGGTPIAGADDTDEGGIAPLAEREEWTIAALQDLLPKLSDRDLRSLLARMMVVDAEQLAAIRRVMGAEPAPGALLTPEGPA